LRVLALDIDGVLTDGQAILQSDGEELKRIDFHDLDAVARAQREGWQVVLITGEDSPAVDRIAERFKVYRVWRGAKDKAAALDDVAAALDIPLSEMCYIGDSDRDAPALALVGLGLAPANATPRAKQAAHHVLAKAGGAGAVAEAFGLLAGLSTTGMHEVVRADMERILNESLAVHQSIMQSVPDLMKVADVFVNALRSGHKILLCGNGGSAADAQHVAAELVGRFLQESEPWPAIALTANTSILTAVGNDWEFEDIFARQVKALARAGDVVVGISTSGRSANVLRALVLAQEMGATTIGFAGKDGRDLADIAHICFCAPAETTQRIQELHLLAWHTICEVVETQLLVLSM